MSPLSMTCRWHVELTLIRYHPRRPCLRLWQKVRRTRGIWEAVLALAVFITAAQLLDQPRQIFVE